MIIITCPIHGDFTQLSSSHLQGYGCKDCGIARTIEQTKNDLKELIIKANIIHDSKYDYSKFIYQGMKIDGIIICPIHGEFPQDFDSHINKKSGCPFCVGKNKTTERFIQEAVLVHGNKYDYSLVNYVRSDFPVKIICSIHGEFEQIPNSHLQGYGCRDCANEELSIDRRKSLEQRIKEFNIIHDNKYDYSLVKEIKNARDFIDIICPIHGPFTQQVTSHQQGCGCDLCGKEIIFNSRKYSTKEWIEKFRKIHNEKYDYSLIDSIENSLQIIYIICPKHDKFPQKVESHSQGQGCPYCQDSYMEKITKSLLLSKNINFIQEKRINCYSKKGLRLDFYIELNGIKYAIECQGIQHYEPVEFFGGEKVYNEQIIKDNDKREYCINNNIKLLEIPYWSNKSKLKKSVIDFLGL